MTPNTPETREKCARVHVEGMEFGDLMALAEAALCHLYETDQDYFEDAWDNYVGGGE